MIVSTYSPIHLVRRSILLGSVPTILSRGLSVTTIPSPASATAIPLTSPTTSGSLMSGVVA